MNRNVLIVLAGGFLIAVLVALLVQASLSGGKEPAPVVVQKEEKVQIVVAAKDIEAGAMLSADKMEWQDWPESGVFPGAVTREDDKKTTEMVSGRVSRSLKKGEPIVESALVPARTNVLAATIEEGKRAVSIRVKAEAGMVSGFVGPGDYVDILLTYKKSVRYSGGNAEIQSMVENTIDKIATETILENVKILAVDQKTNRTEEDAVRVGDTVTLEVDQRQAEILAVASDIGSLSLTLRPLGDKTSMGPVTHITTDARVTNIEDEVTGRINQMQDSSGQTGKVVRIYRGESIEEVPVSP